jgi:hypothetical protein
MIWILSQTNLDLIDPVCDISERILPLVPENLKQVCFNAIDAVRRRYPKRKIQDAANFARIFITNISSNLSFRASDSAAYMAARTANAARAAGYAATAYAADGGATYADYAVAHAIAYNAMIFNDVDFYVVRTKEQKKQCDIIRGYFTINQVKEAFNKLVA